MKIKDGPLKLLDYKSQVQVFDWPNMLTRNTDIFSWSFLNVFSIQCSKQDSGLKKEMKYHYLLIILPINSGVVFWQAMQWLLTVWNIIIDVS